MGVKMSTHITIYMPFSGSFLSLSLYAYVFVYINHNVYTWEITLIKKQKRRRKRDICACHIHIHFLCEVLSFFPVRENWAGSSASTETHETGLSLAVDIKMTTHPVRNPSGIKQDMLPRAYHCVRIWGFWWSCASVIFFGAWRKVGRERKSHYPGAPRSMLQAVSVYDPVPPSINPHLLGFLSGIPRVHCSALQPWKAQVSDTKSEGITIYWNLHNEVNAKR